MFVDDPSSGELHIFTPARELPLAGHALVGTAWLLLQHHRAPRLLRPPAVEVPYWWEDQTVWIRADIAQAPAWQHLEFDDPRAVETLTGPPEGHDAVQVWAWEDRQAGRVRARVFDPRFGVVED